jgi:hypothetical protein
MIGVWVEIIENRSGEDGRTSPAATVHRPGSVVGGAAASRRGRALDTSRTI